MSPDKTPQNLFNEALERKDAAERARFLDEACGADTALRERVERLLRAQEELGAFMAQPSRKSTALNLNQTLCVSSPLTEKPGDRIGRYKLLQQIGEGGCGVVYMAEQEEPVRRRVALKVIKLGMDTKQVIARFEAERQALAMMDHPNIARVLDAGATDSGRPFFVMELVRGVKITEFCDEKELSTQERLDLFLKVCSAIQHAHQKGVIHRDAKPSNILVTIVDGVPVPKVIDFGIAKATNNQPLTDKTLFTAFEQFIGTPAYMSPEQAELSGVDIDTRTDIYSLGVVLYELLTGGTPFDQNKLLAAGLEGMRRTIREEEPPRPSNRLSTMAADALTMTAQHRHTEPPRLIYLVRGDLDWIVMKCLEKDRARRYETANALAADIRRHLANEPVVARPPSRWYEFQKTVRRHKFGFAATAAVIAALATGLAVATWMFAKERQAYQRAVAAEEDARKKQVETEAARWKLQSSEREKRHNLYVAEMHLARSAWEEGQLGKARELLRSHIPEPGQEDFRGFEWRYLWRLCQGGALATLTGHKDFVQCLALSSDGRLLGTGSGDGVIKLWDTVTRREILTLQFSTEDIRSLAISPDGRTLVAADIEDALRFLDLSSHQDTVVPGPFPRGHKMVRFFPDGRVLACATIDGAVTLWDVKTKTRVGTLQGEAKRRPAIAISPDGSMLAATSGHRDILLWDMTSRRHAVLQGHTANVVWLQFSPDGATLASCSADTTVRLWDVASRRQTALLRGHRVWVSSVAFSPDGRTLVSTSVDGLIKLWDVESRAELGDLRGHNAWVNEAAFLPDGHTLVSVSDDRTVKFWDTSSCRSGSMLAGPALPATDFTFLPDGRALAVLGADDNLTFWDTDSGKRTFQLAGRFKGLSENGRLVLGEGVDGKLELWDSITHEAITTIHERMGSPRAAALSPDDRYLACAGREGTLRVWEVATGRLLGTLTATTPIVEELWFPDGMEGPVLGFQCLPEAPDMRALFSRRTYQSLEIASAIDPAERFRFWDIQSGRVTDSLPKNVQRIRQSFENRYSLSLVRDGIGRVRIESLAMPTNHPTRLISYLPTADGKTIIIGGERDITLWEVETGRRVATLVGQGGWITGLALSPNGLILASASNDGTLRLWNLALRKEVITLPGQIAPWTQKVAFSSDGNSIAALSPNEDRMIRFFHAPSMVEIEQIEAAKGPPISPR